MNYSYLLDHFFKKLGVDLGTTRTRIWFEDKVIVDEPTCLAIDQQTRKVLAIGKEAEQMRGRMPEGVSIVYPVVAGQLEHIAEVEAYLRVLWQRVIGHSYFLRPIVMVSLPAFADSIVHQAVVDVMYSVGAREVYTIAQPLAAAIGAGVPIADTSGSFILHLGGGVVEAAAITLGSLVRSTHSAKAGMWCDQAIVQAIKKTTELQVSLETAERLKKKVGSVGGRAGELLISGQDIATGAPKEVSITQAQLIIALKPLAEVATHLMQTLLSTVPPELTADVIDKGMLLTGGLAQIHGLDSYLVQTLGVPVSVVEDPDLSTIKGIGTALLHLDLFKESLGYQMGQR